MPTQNWMIFNSKQNLVLHWGCFEPHQKFDYDIHYDIINVTAITTATTLLHPACSRLNMWRKSKDTR